MALVWQHLCGREYDEHSANCSHVVRDFYTENYNIAIPHYACPHLWWQQGLDIFGKFYFQAGFDSLDIHPREHQPGDVILLSHDSSVANHLGVLLDNGRMLHHMFNSFSKDDPYASGGFWRSKTVGVLRHRQVRDLPPPPTTDLWSLLPDHVRTQLPDSSIPVGTPDGGS